MTALAAPPDEYSDQAEYDAGAGECPAPDGIVRRDRQNQEDHGEGGKQVVNDGEHGSV